MFEYSMILRWRYERTKLARTQIKLKKEVQSLVQSKPEQITTGHSEKIITNTSEQIQPPHSIQDFKH